MAKVFLEPDEHYTIANNNTKLFGAGGYETVRMMDSITGLEVNQNTEQVAFSGGWSDYNFKQQGNKILVYSADKTAVVAAIPVQTDDDGTVLEFDNGSVNAVFHRSGDLLGKITFNDTLISNGDPAPYNPPPVVYEHNINSAGAAVNDTAQNDLFHIAVGTYDYTIQGFNAGDVLDFPDGAVPTVINDVFDGNEVILQWAASGNTVVVTITDLNITSEQDIQLSGIDGWNAVFGEGTII